jgi:Uma2 family endonuclease
MATVATKAITAEELEAMGDIGRCELIRGEIVHMTPAGAEHGDVGGEAFHWVKAFVKEHRLGKVYSADTGFVIARDPDTVRAPDVAFVRAQRIPPHPVRGFFPGAPDLAVEVVSPSDRLSEVAAKVDEWLSAGTQSVWVVDPANRSVEVYRQGNQVLRYRAGDELRDEPALPGFAMKIADLFAGV